MSELTALLEKTLKKIPKDTLTAILKSNSLYKFQIMLDKYGIFYKEESDLKKLFITLKSQAEIKNASTKDTKFVENNLHNIADNIKDEEILTQFIEANKKIFNIKAAGDYYLQCLSDNNLSLKELNLMLINNPVKGKPLISTSYVSHFLSGRKPLSRDNLIILAILGRLTYEQTATLFKYAQIRDFYIKDKRDAIIKFLISQRDKISDSLTLYKKSEEFLKNHNQRPLCNKIDPPKVSHINYNYTNCDSETRFLDARFQDITTDDELIEFLKDNISVVQPEEVLKYRKVSSFLLQCIETNKNIKDNKTRPKNAKEFISKIIEECALHNSTIYHLFNMSENDSIVKPFTRNNIIAFGIVGGLNRSQIERALFLNQNSPLYLRDIRNLYISYCIETKHTYMETESLLYNQGLDLLNNKFLKYISDADDEEW